MRRKSSVNPYLKPPVISASVPFRMMRIEAAAWQIRIIHEGQAGDFRHLW